MKLSIRTKILALLIFLNSIITASISYTLYSVSIKNFYENFKRSSVTITRAVAQVVEGELESNWDKSSALRDVKFQKVQKLIQTIWKNENIFSYLYVLKYNPDKNGFYYVLANSFDRDIVWMEFSDTALSLFVDENGDTKINYKEDYYDSKFNIKLSSMNLISGIKKERDKEIFFIDSTEIFEIISVNPLRIQYKDLIIDSKNNYKNIIPVKIKNKVLDLKISFTSKNTPFAKPGDAFEVNNTNFLEQMKYSVRTGRETLHEEILETLYGQYLTISVPFKDSNGSNIGLVCFDVPEHRFKEFEFDIKTTTFIFFIISFILTVLLSYYLAEYFDKPIQKLILATQKISKEDYSHTININTGDEFEILANSFNSMSKSVWDSKKSQIDYLNDLELKVNERTKELNSAKEEAMNSARSRYEFLATMSHEIRTPLNGVLGMARLLADTSLTKEQKEYLSIIDKSGELLLTLINDILDMSKIDSGKIEINNEDFSLKDTVRNCLEILSPRIQEKKINVFLSFDTIIPEKIYGSQIRYKQILINLISNSVKFTEKGKIEILISTTKEEDSVIVLTAVKDTGIGIEDSFKEKIFQTFTQADSSLHRKYGGSGLGLSISKKLAKILGGDMWFESEFGKGSNFYFTIKAKEVMQVSLLEKNSLSKVKKINPNLKILVAEDNEVNQKLILKILQKQSLKADLASDGLEAIKKAEEKSYDIIFMDIQMPKMDGIKATEIILQNQKSSSTKIIAFTANVMEEDLLIYKKKGFSDFISKPFQIESVYEILQKYS